MCLHRGKGTAYAVLRRACRVAVPCAVLRRVVPCGAVCHVDDAVWCRVALYSAVCIVCFAPPERRALKLSGQQPAGTVERLRGT
eukprot:gene9660-biopygen5503